MVTADSPANRKRRYANQPTQHRDGHNQLGKASHASNIHNWSESDTDDQLGVIR
jgi:hypothetical protein